MEMIKTFIEIGTSDFDTCLDLVNKGNWMGVMVEPNPKCMDSIKKQVAESPHASNVQFATEVISDFNGKIAFTTSRQDGEEWVKGISTVTAPSHRGERLFDYPENQLLIDEHLELPCITLNTLLARYEYEHINFLKIDTEGHELNILEAYDWEIKPDLIKVEHSHLDDKYLAKILKEQGYTVYTEETDLYGIL